MTCRQSLYLETLSKPVFRKWHPRCTIAKRIGGELNVVRVTFARRFISLLMALVIVLPAPYSYGVDAVTAAATKTQASPTTEENPKKSPDEEGELAKYENLDWLLKLVGAAFVMALLNGGYQTVSKLWADKKVAQKFRAAAEQIDQGMKKLHTDIELALEKIRPFAEAEEAYLEARRALVEKANATPSQQQGKQKKKKGGSGSAPRQITEASLDSLLDALWRDRADLRSDITQYRALKSQHTVQMQEWEKWEIRLGRADNKIVKRLQTLAGKLEALSRILDADTKEGKMVRNLLDTSDLEDNSDLFEANSPADFRNLLNSRRTVLTHCNGAYRVLGHARGGWKRPVKVVVGQIGVPVFLGVATAATWLSKRAVGSKFFRVYHTTPEDKANRQRQEQLAKMAADTDISQQIRLDRPSFKPVFALLRQVLNEAEKSSKVQETIVTQLKKSREGKALQGTLLENNWLAVTADDAAQKLVYEDDMTVALGIAAAEELGIKNPTKEQILALFDGNHIPNLEANDIALSRLLNKTYLNFINRRFSEIKNAGDKIDFSTIKALTDATLRAIQQRRKLGKPFGQSIERTSSVETVPSSAASLSVPDRPSVQKTTSVAPAEHMGVSLTNGVTISTEKISSSLAVQTHPNHN